MAKIYAFRQTVKLTESQSTESRSNVAPALRQPIDSLFGAAVA